MALSPSREVRMVVAVTLARIGNAPMAKHLAGELETKYPNDTELKLLWLPTIDAAIDLSHGNSSQALMELESTDPYELGFQGPMQTSSTPLMYVAKLTSWRTTVLLQRGSFKNYWIIVAW